MEYVPDGPDARGKAGGGGVSVGVFLPYVYDDVGGRAPASPCMADGGAGDLFTSGSTTTGMKRRHGETSPDDTAYARHHPHHPFPSSHLPQQQHHHTLKYAAIGEARYNDGDRPVRTAVLGDEERDWARPRPHPPSSSASEQHRPVQFAPLPPPPLPMLLPLGGGYARGGPPPLPLLAPPLLASTLMPPPPPPPPLLPGYLQRYDPERERDRDRSYRG